MIENLHCQRVGYGKTTGWVIDVRERSGRGLRALVLDSYCIAEKDPRENFFQSSLHAGIR